MTDLFVMTELHIRDLQENFGLTDDEIAAQLKFILAPSATVVEIRTWNNHEKEYVSSTENIKNRKPFKTFAFFVDQMQHSRGHNSQLHCLANEFTPMCLLKNHFKGIDLLGYSFYRLAGVQCARSTQGAPFL